MVNKSKEALTEENYIKLYHWSITEPQQFWDHHAKNFLHWFSPWNTVVSGSFEAGNIQWFEGGQLNACYNCVDRHLPKLAHKTALIWESDDGKNAKQFTYQMLYLEICRFANVLKKLGIKKGDKVCIYLPMIPEAVFAMLACARIGAIHSVVFAGFSAHALQTRINNSACSLLITADEGKRGGKIIPLKKQADEAVENCPTLRHMLIISYSSPQLSSKNPLRDLDYYQVASEVSSDCPIEIMESEDPLFILYTSGSTGQPKGMVHTTGGYLLYTAITYHYLFHQQENEVFWSTADIGWITGHSYTVYGPLSNACTIVLFEGVPNWPTVSRCSEIIDKYKVNIFYTAPTLLRTLMREESNSFLKPQNKSLRILGSVGEPINPEAWQWYDENIGQRHCPILDTWWQTETGGIMISPFSTLQKLKPGAAMKPFLGIKPAVIDNHHKLHTEKANGKLVICYPWPGLARTVYGEHQRYLDTYFKPFPGYYFSGDNAKIDEQGDFWIMGRVDDIINVAGHRLSTAEIEGAITEHFAVAEAAAIGVPDPIKGQTIYAFVTLKLNQQPSQKLMLEIKETVKRSISAIAVPQYIQWAFALPKTRSGKIMRRILRKIVVDQTNDLGDTSTLAEPSVIASLIKEAQLTGYSPPSSSTK